MAVSKRNLPGADGQREGAVDRAAQDAGPAVDGAGIRAGQRDGLRLPMDTTLVLRSHTAPSVPAALAFSSRVRLFT